jgi:hypothetical protein
VFLPIALLPGHWPFVAEKNAMHAIQLVWSASQVVWISFKKISHVDRIELFFSLLQQHEELKTFIKKKHNGVNTLQFLRGQY